MKHAIPRGIIASLAIAASMALGLISQPAIAADTPAALKADPPPSRSVQFSDLNLAITQDVAELYRRIDVAAYKVCRHHYSARNVYTHRAYKDCHAMAKENAVRQINHVNLTALHEGRRPAVASR